MINSKELTKRFEPIEHNTMLKPGVNRLECFEWDKKRYQSDISFYVLLLST